MKKAKNKWRKKSKIFWKIWAYVVLICHIIIFFSMISGKVGVYAGLFLMVLTWIITGGLATLEDELERKYDYKNKKQFKVDNPFFGTCLFEQKPEEFYMKLVESTNKMRFGTHSPEIRYRGNDTFIPKALEKLEELFGKADNILEQIYEAAFEQCLDWEEVDADGIPVDLEFVKKFCSLGQIIVIAEDNENISIRLISNVLDQKGNLLLGDHDIVMEFDCNTEEISFNLEG